MENRKKYNYYEIEFNLYKVEVGVLLDKDNTDYECYNSVYDKKNAYYDENVVFELDYMRALEYAKYYVDNGVNGTYAIISKLKYNSKQLYGGCNDEEIDIVSYDLNNILGGHFLENYIDLFDSELYSLDNIIYSLYKVKDKDHPYRLEKGNGQIIENFIKKESEM